MSGINYIHDKALTKMREDFLECNRKFKHIKHLYSLECANSSKLEKKLKSVMHHKELMAREIFDLKTIAEKKKHFTSNTTKRHRKQWQEISCDRTKRRRIADYKDKFFEILKSINGCHRCEITLWICKNRICFSWGPTNFKKNRSSDMSTEKNGSFSDHTYAMPPKEDNTEEEIYDINYSEMFENNGTWHKQHIRRMIHVMDTFRISNEGYHELRMVSKGQLPPIGQIRKEKKIMSQQLPYIKHPKVNI